MKVSNEYVSEVLAKLSSNPTAQDIDYFIEAHARIGYLVGVAQSRAEYAEAERKFNEASAFTNAIQDGAKSAANASAIATVETRDFRNREIAARESYTKLKNLLDSIEQAINGIKYVGRATDVSLPSTRR